VAPRGIEKRGKKQKRGASSKTNNRGEVSEKNPKSVELPTKWKKWTGPAENTSE